MTLGYGFDDGPNCSHNAFYDFLTSQNQKASEWSLIMVVIPDSVLIGAGNYVLHWEQRNGLASGSTESCV